MTRKKRLGRGLEALLSAGPDSETIAAESATATEPVGGQQNADTVYLSVYEIDDNPFQPRREFSESEINSLAESLKEHDILQPILVRIVDGRYQLISGERRLRAAIQANWKKIPARIRNADDRLVAELAIVENLQRKDLNPIEKALSFRRYIDEHGCTQEDLANRLKIDRSTIANLMRLLELPNVVQQALGECLISAGHARALLPLGEEELQVDFCNKIQADGMSVRAVEAAVSDWIAEQESTTGKVPRGRRPRNRQIESLEKNLKLALGTRVKIRQKARGTGSVVIEFANADEFERIYGILAGNDQPMRRAA